MPAQQTWPWLKKMPLTMPSIAWSMGASSKTMFAALPPSSRVTFLSVPATCLAIARPTRGRAGEGDLVDVRRARTSAAPVSPAPVMMLTTPGGRSACCRISAKMQRRERRGLRGLQHDRVARGERRGDLPREHEQREVPRDDLRGDAERARVRAEAGVVELVGPAGVVEEPRGDEGHVDVARLLDGLAVVEATRRRRARGRAPARGARCGTGTCRGRAPLMRDQVGRRRGARRRRRRRRRPAFACAIVAMRFSVAGEMVWNGVPRPSTNSPSMNRP